MSDALLERAVAQSDAARVKASILGWPERAGRWSAIAVVQVLWARHSEVMRERERYGRGHTHPEDDQDAWDQVWREWEGQDE